ncbi:hypothetical protein HK104_001922, partial [Borealophlyctis nickersoniae]
ALAGIIVATFVVLAGVGAAAYNILQRRKEKRKKRSVLLPVATPTNTKEVEGFPPDEEEGGRGSSRPDRASVRVSLLAGAAERVKIAYEKQQQDELDLHEGDEVRIKIAYDDGWALGYNLTTNKEGMFPVSCMGYDA